MYSKKENDVSALQRRSLFSLFMNQADLNENFSGSLIMQLSWYFGCDLITLATKKEWRENVFFSPLWNVNGSREIVKIGKEKTLI